MDPIVLVVDDDPGIRESLLGELRAAGYDAITADDGRSGLAAVRLHLPELLLTYLAMPGADGFQLIAAVRRTHSARDSEVGEGREVDQRAARLADLEAYVLRNGTA